MDVLKPDPSENATIVANLPDPDHNYARYKWRLDDSQQLIIESTRTIELRASRSFKPKTFLVHLELLRFYSSRYRVALKGEFLESTKGKLDVNAGNEDLSMLVKWLYSGRVVTENIEILDNLYILAREIDIIALRRDLLDATQKIETEEICKVDSELFAKLFNHLGRKSPIFIWHAEFYVNHVDNDLSMKEIDRCPVKFFYLVTKRQAELLALDPKERRQRDCPCCHDLCSFHEHSSDEERAATCGPQNKNNRESTKPWSLWRSSGLASLLFFRA